MPRGPVALSRLLTPAPVIGVRLMNAGALSLGLKLLWKIGEQYHSRLKVQENVSEIQWWENLFFRISF